MKAIVVHTFGGPDVLSYSDVPVPKPASDEVIVKVRAAGVGPWDAWVREGKSALGQQLPVIPGADLSGTVYATGANSTAFEIGASVYGVTNPRFIGAYAEFAVCDATRLAAKPASLDFLEAASAPVVAVSAYQMVFEYAKVQPGQTVLIHGAGGNVGAYAVQCAKIAKARVIGTGSLSDRAYLESIGLDQFIDFRLERFEDVAHAVDAVLDTVGGDTLARSFAVTREGGTVVSSVSEPPPNLTSQSGRHGLFFLVDVTQDHLHKLAQLFDSAAIQARLGEVLPINEARRAHEMLAGAPHRSGRIVLDVERPT